MEKRVDVLIERNFHTAAEFREHLRFFSQRSVLSVGDLLKSLSNGDPLPEQAVTITFDDGYQNNLLAAELLAAARMPWTMFVTTGVVESNTTIWPVELSLLLLMGQCKALEAFGKKWPMQTLQNRETAFQKVRVLLKEAAAPERESEMEHIRTQFPSGESIRLLERWPSVRMCSWREIAQLAASGVDIGSHGVSHELHHDRQLPEVRKYELSESRQTLERSLEQACRYFAFPNGDTNEASAREVRDSGYDAAFTTHPDTIGLNHSRWLLPRLSAPKSLERFVEQFHWKR